jgi:hypothetical protein
MLLLSAVNPPLGLNSMNARITAPNAISGMQTVRVALAVMPSIASDVTTNFLPWGGSGNAVWFGQSATTHDGISAAQSGLVTNDGRSWLEMELAGPSQLEFWWKVSSEANYDYLSLFLDGALTNKISGDVDWQYQQVAFTNGVHRVRWEYAKDNSVSAGADAAWLDEVRLLGQPDRDTNGIPDEWEYRFFANPTGAVAGADSDTDRWTNVEEYIGDTNPTNPASFFQGIVRLVGSGPFSADLADTSARRLYRILATTNLAGSVQWTGVSGEAWGNGSNLSLSITGVPPVRFLRSSVRLP